MNNPNEAFSIIVIPDTQMLSVSPENSEIYRKMAQWVKENASALQLRMVLHLGDVVHHGAREEGEFRAAERAFAEIDEAGIPMLVTPGNHDYDNILEADRSLTLFNRYFGIRRYADKPWFGGAFQGGRVENCYATLDIGGSRFLFLALEFGPREEVMEWADGLLRAHPDHHAIIITHSFMYMYGERTKPGDAHNPKDYRGADGAHDGEDMWKWLKRHRNLIAVFSGHHIPGNVSCRLDRGEAGNAVLQSFQNWQCEDNGGEGRFRILTIRPASQEMKLQVFNPYTETYETEEGYEFEFFYGGHPHYRQA